MDIRSRVSSREIEDAKIDRERMTNPPDIKQGMEEDIDFDNDDFGGKSPSLGPAPSLGPPRGMPPLGGPPMGIPPMGGSPLGMPPLGGAPMGMPPMGGLGGVPPMGLGGIPPMGMNNPMNQPQQPKKEFLSDEKISEMADKGAKEAFSYFKDLVDSFKYMNALQLADTFRYTIIASLGYALLLVIMFILGKVSFSSLYAPILSVAFSIVGFAISYGVMQKNPNMQHPKEVKKSKMIETNNNQQPQGVGLGAMGGMPPMSPPSNHFPIEEEEEPIEVEDEEELEFDDDITLDDLEEDDEFELDEDLVVPTNESTTPVNSESEIDRLINAISESTYMSRENLYNMYMQILPHETPDFSETNPISANTEEFDIWDACIKKSANVFRPSNGDDKDIPNLIEARKNMFYTYLIISRTPWVKKVEPFVDELVRLIALDTSTGRVADNITGMGELSGDRMYIKIIENKPTIISLADVMKVNKEFFVNPKNKMPVAMGVTEEGDVLLEDFNNVNTLLITGMPRSGKTASAKTIITQLAMFNPPSEVQFAILDPKEGISDFKNYDLPHVKLFKTTDEEVVSTLRSIITTEGARREKLFASLGVSKIQDYNELRPEAKVPFLYVIIDEVITLAERMEPDVKKEFQKMLNIIVSKMPAYGIRVLMIPHVVKDNIISKTTTDLIPCRISVCGSPKHVEAVTGATPSEFKYKLANIGDMAIRMFQKDVIYGRGVLYARDLGERKTLDFIRDLWVKIEPNSYKGSYAETYSYERERILRNIEGISNGADGVITTGGLQREPVVNPLESNIGAIKVNESVSSPSIKLNQSDALDILKDDDDSMKKFL